MRALIGVELLRRLPAGPVDIRDTKLPGFVLRVRESGTHTFYATWTPKVASAAPDGTKRRASARWYVLGTPAVLSAPEARDEARKVLADVARGDDPIAAKQAEDRRITFATFVADHYTPWLTAQRPRGAEQAARLRRVFGPTLDALRLDEITAFAIERWRSGRLTAGAALATVNRDLAVVKAALPARSNGACSPRIRSPRCGWRSWTAAGIVRYLSPTEETRLRAALIARDTTRRAERASANAWRRERGYALWPEHGSYTDHITPIVLLALNTGLRRGELFNLRWADVDLTRAIVTVKGGGAKSGQTRHVPLNSEAVAVLKAWKPTDADAAAPVFPGEDGAPLADIKSAWLPLVAAAKVRAFRFHDLRHTFASKLVMAGVDLNTVRELLGHADLKMTLRYAHLAPEHKAAAVAKLVQA